MLDWPEAFLVAVVVLVVLVLGVALIFAPEGRFEWVTPIPETAEYFTVIDGIVVDVQDGFVDARALLNTNIREPEAVVSDGIGWRDTYPIDCKDVGVKRLYVDAPNMVAPLETHVIIQDGAEFCQEEGP